ncbi:unnamed protein product [Thelazia callipaeda]|uniref:MARVEL domain-containing protein n=1 Tax=Thelazia callipaeda TaxID=103827 RepID=A0A0N5CRY6_THECL|nr:unnamed protein product [Thelazia callipaeda]
MCLSLAGQIVYGAVMLVALGLTAGSMFSPGWYELNKTANNITDDLKNFKFPAEIGIFSFLCKTATDYNTTVNADANSFDFCKEWYQQLPSWEKAVVIFMCFSLAGELVAVVWTAITIFGCCCRQLFAQLLPVFALAVTIFLAIAIILFRANQQDAISGIDFSDVPQDWKISINSQAGYSFYLACGALALTIMDIFVGLASIYLSKFCC